MDRALAGHALPAADRDVDIKRVDLDAATDAAGALRRHQGRPAAQKRIEHDVAADRVIEKRVGDQPDRLNGRMELVEAPLLARLGEGRRARVFPDVGPVATMLSQFDVVAMRGARNPEHADELVARAIKAAHAAIVFDPDAAVELLEADGTCGAEKFVLMAPVLAPELHRAGGAKGGAAGHGPYQEGEELLLGHLADGHRELAVRQPRALADEAGNLHVVRRIGEGDLSQNLAHQRRVAPHLQGVGAENAVRPKAPEIARASYSGPCAVDRLNLVLRLRRFRLFDDEIDRRHFEARHRYIK